MGQCSRKIDHTYRANSACNHFTRSSVSRMHGHPKNGKTTLCWHYKIVLCRDTHVLKMYIQTTGPPEATIVNSLEIQERAGLPPAVWLIRYKLVWKWVQTWLAIHEIRIGNCNITSSYKDKKAANKRLTRCCWHRANQIFEQIMLCI